MPETDSVAAALPDRTAASLAAELAPRGRGSTVRGAGGPLTVYRSGAGAPVMPMHGITATALQRHPVLPALARRHEVIAVDTRGHGRIARAGARIAR